jgi:hypothetical protein
MKAKHRPGLREVKIGRSPRPGELTPAVVGEDDGFAGLNPPVPLGEVNGYLVFLVGVDEVLLFPGLTYKANGNNRSISRMCAKIIKRTTDSLVRWGWASTLIPASVMANIWGVLATTLPKLQTKGLIPSGTHKNRCQQ